jgi:hypothetical protein
VLELYYEKENSMIIVRDIQDAMTMKKKLSSLARRAHNYQKTRTTIIIELFELCEELEKNIEREERNIEAEVI